VALAHRPPKSPFCGIVRCVQYCDDDRIALNGEVDGLGKTAQQRSPGSRPEILVRGAGYRPSEWRNAFTAARAPIEPHPASLITASA